LKDKNSWESICDEIQNRSLQSTQLTIPSAKNLYNQIFKCLNDANDNGILKTKHQEIRELLKMKPSEKNKNEILIRGGRKEKERLNFTRSKDVPHFERIDECWFDFGISIDDSKKETEIIGFGFEIRFPEDHQVKFIRFDLNLPNHKNEERGMRFHLHPGSDDLMIHSPPMSPLEILHLFLYGLPLREKPRSS